MKQVDGSHYEDMPDGYSPWDIIKALDLDYWEGSVLKYLLRAGRKPGVLKSVDLRKAVHQLSEYADLVEAEEAKEPVITIHPGKVPPEPVTKVSGAGRLYRCPSGHYVPVAPGAPHRFIRHDQLGRWVGIDAARSAACEFTGAYVPMSDEDAAKMARGEE